MKIAWILPLVLSAGSASAAGPDPLAVAARLAGTALVGGHAYAIVQSLTDRVGQRLAGSPGAERAVEGARLGAVAALIRSVGTGAYRLPHTGATRYDPKVPSIPYAALAAEDADLVHRLLVAGETVRAKLRLGCGLQGEVESANVVGELRGRQHPDQVVLVGAHLDSWDLGAGAIDDGAGCAIV